MDLVDRAMAALRRSVLPSVIARGGTVRVVAVEEGTAILEVRGSPGAVLPLAARALSPRRTCSRSRAP